MRMREAEDRDDGVPDELLEDAAVLGDRFARQVVVPAQENPDVLRVERIAKGGRSRHIGEEDRDDATLFSHECLPLEEADAAATAIALAAAFRHDADAAVVFQHRHFHVAQLVYAVLADRHLDVGLAESFLFQRHLADLAILDHDGRRWLDPGGGPSPAAAEEL